MFQGKSFRKNIKIIIATNDKVRDRKLQYDVNKEPAKISALLSVKIDKYEYLIGGEILTPYSNRTS